MQRLRVLTFLLCVGLLGVVFLPSAYSDQWNKKTKLTFKESVELPGAVVLQPGDYVMKLVDSQSNRHIVQVLNADEDHVYATILAIPNYRLQPTGETVITFHETPVGEPRFMRAWFYPGDNFGQEFAYPRERAVQLARATGANVPVAPTQEGGEITAVTPEEKEVPVESGEKAESAQATTPPATTEQQTTTQQPKTEEEQQITQAQPQEQPPAAVEQEPAQQPMAQPERLPATASNLPLLGLAGLASVGASLAMRIASRFL